MTSSTASQRLCRKEIRSLSSPLQFFLWVWYFAAGRAARSHTAPPGAENPGILCPYTRIGNAAQPPRSLIPCASPICAGAGEGYHVRETANGRGDHADPGAPDGRIRALSIFRLVSGQCGDGRVTARGGDA